MPNRKMPALEKATAVSKKETAGSNNAAGGSRRLTVVTTIIIAAFFAVAVLNIVNGSVRVPFEEVIKSVFRGKSDAYGFDILWRVRFPRLIAAALLGGALSISGFLLQTFFNNPIAGPFVLGISSGAKLVVALVMVLVVSRGSTTGSVVLIIAAFAGSMISMGLVLLVSRKVTRASALIICGVMIGYICSAITDFIVTFANDESIVNLHNWSQGSFSGISWTNIGVIATATLAAASFAFLLSKPLGAYQLGEGYARSVGVNIRVFRVILVLLSSFLCAVVTAFAGPISFVGVAVPHLIKSAARTARPIVVIPLCFVGGAAFCLGCDLIARTAFAPAEMSVSSVSSLFGAPVVIYMMARRATAV